MGNFIPANRIVRNLSWRDERQIDKLISRYLGNKSDLESAAWLNRAYDTVTPAKVRAEAPKAPLCGCGGLLDTYGNCVRGEAVLDPTKKDDAGRPWIKGYRPHENRGKKRIAARRKMTKARA